MMLLGSGIGSRGIVLGNRGIVTMLRGSAIGSRGIVPGDRGIVLGPLRIVTMHDRIVIPRLRSAHGGRSAV